MTDQYLGVKSAGAMKVEDGKPHQPSSRKTAGDLLNEAAAMVDGTRQTTHGDKHHNFNTTAAFWSIYLEALPRNQSGVTGRNVAQMMELLKISRSICGDPAYDHFLDSAGYAGIAGELATTPAPSR
jgi:hypothetical protein